MRTRIRPPNTRQPSALAHAALLGALLVGPLTLIAAAPNDAPNTAPSSATDPSQPAAGLREPVPQAVETARVDRGGIRQELPDEASAEEVRGQYGLGITSLIVGGVILSMATVSLFIFFLRRSWSASH